MSTNQNDMPRCHCGNIARKGEKVCGLHIPTEDAAQRKAQLAEAVVKAALMAMQECEEDHPDGFLLDRALGEKLNVALDEWERADAAEGN
jgi:hypothetical protein